MTIPCPKCRKANPVEARACSCGHWFFGNGGVESKDFPPLRSILPELHRELSAKQPKAVPIADAVPETLPSIPMAVRSPSETQRSPVFVSAPLKTEPTVSLARVEPVPTEDSIDLFTVPYTENKSRRWRYLVPAGAMVAILAAAATWAGYSGFADGFEVQVPSEETKQNGPATPGPEPADPGATSAFAPAEPEASGTQLSETTPESDVSTEQALTRSGVVSTDSGSPQRDSRSVAQPAELNGSAHDANNGTTIEVVSTSEQQEADRAKAVVNDTQAAGAPPPDQPAKTTGNRAVPVARCTDGTYSYRSSRGEVCAYRGGVAEWMDAKKPAVKPEPTGSVPENRTYVLGPRGGCYYLSPSGKKVYVEKKFCD